MFRLAQPHVLPGFPAVGALVHAITESDATIGIVFPSPEPDNIWVHRVNRHAAQGIGTAIVKEGLLTLTAIDCFPKPSGTDRRKPDTAIARVHGNVGNPAWLQSRTERSQSNFTDKFLRDLIGPIPAILPPGKVSLRQNYQR